MEGIQKGPANPSSGQKLTAKRDLHDDVLRVSSHSNPNAIAGAIAAILRSKGRTEISVIGAAALNQAIKAIAIARGFLAPIGREVICFPIFEEMTIDGRERTAIRLMVEIR